MKVTYSISTLNATSAAKHQMFRCAASPTPISDFSVSASEFQTFPYRRPFGNGSGQKLQTLLSQREVML